MTQIFDHLVPEPLEITDAAPHDNAGSSGDDKPTTRRALLTGGAVAAGAAAVSIASTGPAAAATYVALGATNSASAFTRIISSGPIAFVGVATPAESIGVQGNSAGTNGIGVIGYGLNGSSSTGVKGVSTDGTGVRGEGTNTYGVVGTGGYSGMRAQGGTYGTISYGTSVGVYGSGSDYGVYAAGGSYGLYGGGSTYGVYGSGPTGVFGSGSTYGVSGTTTNPNTSAVYGSGGQYGVSGQNGRTAGVRGDSGYVGLWGQGTSWGVYGLATAGSGQTYGIFGQASNGSSFAIWSQGNMHVAGTLSKSAGSFKIDHPLDPEGKWLQHSFVESPDMMNVYNGNVTTDGAGLAVVKLPAYFAALNRDFRYQLTVIGQMAQAIVDQEVANNQFRIRTSAGRVKVSWQVTGIRQDDYAKAHPIVVELAKTHDEVGTREFIPGGASGRLMKRGPQAQ